MEMVYRDRWQAEIAAMRRVLTDFAMKEERKAGLRMEKKKTSDFPVPEELTERFRKDTRFKRAFEALTPGRQRSYLYHFAAAKQSATRAARIEKAMPRDIRRQRVSGEARNRVNQGSLRLELSEDQNRRHRRARHRSARRSRAGQPQLSKPTGRRSLGLQVESSRVKSPYAAGR